MKRLIILSAVLFISSQLRAQSFMHGVGLTLIGGYTGSNSVIFAEGLTYSPRFNFYETEKLSVSAGIPLSIGISSTATSYDLNTQSFGYSLGFVANIPLMINVNAGRGSTLTNRKKVGYFGGVGIAYNRGDFVSIIEVDQDGNLVNHQEDNIGPQVNGGFRFGIGKKHKNIELRLSFFKALNGSKANVFGIAGLFNF